MKSLIKMEISVALTLPHLMSRIPVPYLEKLLLAFTYKNLTPITIKNMVSKSLLSNWWALRKQMY